MIGVLYGHSGVGKSYIANILTSNTPDISRVKTLTTRPKRDGESDSEYHFTDIHYFKDNESELIGRRAFTAVDERTAYTRINHYAIDKNSIDITKKQVIITDLVGFYDLQQHFGVENVVAIYMRAPKDFIQNRASKRNGYNKDSWEKRYNEDSKFVNDSMFDRLAIGDLFVNGQKMYLLDVYSTSVSEQIDFIKEVFTSK